MAETEDSKAKRRARQREWARNWRAANPERVKATQRKWYAAHSEKAVEDTAQWRANNPLKAAFHQHKNRARRQAIPFLLTFDEWATIWLESGHWGERGRHSDQYCMARFGDAGPYAIGNVRICLVLDNHREKVISPEVRSRGQLGRKVSAETRRKISLAAKAQWVRIKSGHPRVS